MAPKKSKRLENQGVYLLLVAEAGLEHATYEPGELPTAPLRDVTISNRIGVTKISIAGAKVRLLVETTKLRNEIMKDLTVI